MLTTVVLIGLISLWMYRRGNSLVRVALTAYGLVLVVAALIWGGPLSSGALFLPLPAAPWTPSPDLPDKYRPVHQGHVDLATGLYIREDEDIVLPDAPWFVWRRAYLSRDRVARSLGIGTTHNADWYLVGDTTLNRAELILENGARIGFDRTSPGTSYFNAMFEHTSTAGKFYGARLGWIGRHWAMRLENGALAIFQACGTDPKCVSALMSLRDPRGRIVTFNRAKTGLLRSVQSGKQLLIFEYDDKGRIVRATHDQHEVLYSYDDKGRLVRSTLDGITRSYRYGARDEMIAIDEPERSVENTYDQNLRLTRQVVRRPQRPDYTETFEYSLHGENVLETEVTDNDGSRTVYRWDEDRRQTLRIHEAEGHSPVMVQFSRGRDSFTRSITVFCTNDGRRVSQEADVLPGEEDVATTELVQRLCN